MTPERVVERWEAPREGASGGRRRLGTALLVLGLLGILWGVLHVLGAVGGPEQPGFANRQTYDEVKPLVHRSMFGGLLRALAGLALAIAGARLRRG
jgi:hypothetical protein